MARPILLLTGFCSSEVAVMKNCGGQSEFWLQSCMTNLVLDVDKVPRVLDGLDVGVGNRVLGADAHRPLAAAVRMSVRAVFGAPRRVRTFESTGYGHPRSAAGACDVPPPRHPPEIGERAVRNGDATRQSIPRRRPEGGAPRRDEHLAPQAAGTCQRPGLCTFC